MKTTMAVVGALILWAGAGVAQEWIVMKNGSRFMCAEIKQFHAQNVVIDTGKPKGIVSFRYADLTPETLAMLRERKALRDAQNTTSSAVDAMRRMYWLKVATVYDDHFRAWVAEAQDIRMGVDPTSVQGQQSLWVKGYDAKEYLVTILGAPPRDWMEDSTWIVPLYRLGVERGRPKLTIDRRIAEAALLNE